MTLTHSEIDKRYRLRHPDRVYAQHKKWRESNKEKVLEMHRNWRIKNRDKINANQRRWRHENKDKVRQYNVKYFKKSIPGYEERPPKPQQILIVDKDWNSYLQDLWRQKQE